MTTSKTFNADQAVVRIMAGKTVHCLATDETCSQAKVEGGKHILLVMNKDKVHMHVKNFLGTYTNTMFADGPLPEKKPEPAK